MDDTRQPLNPRNSVPYLLAVVIMAIVTMAAITIIAVARTGEDNATLYAMIIGFATTTTAAVLAFMKSQETHLSVNSRLDQFIRNADRSARAEGELAGRAAGRELADARTDQLSHVKPPEKTPEGDQGKAHLEIAATLVAPEGEPIRVEDIAGSIRPKDEHK